MGDGWQEIYREKIPFLDESLELVGTQRGKLAWLRLVRLEKHPAHPSYGRDVTIHDVCRFENSEIVFSSTQLVYMATNVGNRDDSNISGMTNAERLCFSSVPKGHDVTQISRMLKDPYWQHVIDYFTAACIMGS